MGERLTTPFGYQLHLDPGFVPGSSPSLVPFRLTVPGPLGTPSWNAAKSAARTKERARGHAAAKTPLEQFKQDLIAMQVAARVKKGSVYMEGLEAAALKEIPGGVSKGKTPHMRTDVAVKFTEMWDDLVEAYDARAGAAPGDFIGVASAYRSAKEDAGAWERAFPKYYQATLAARQETKDEFGKQSLAIIFAFMNGKKAPPGFSGHTHGIAADLTTKEKGKEWVVNSNYSHQVGWQKTWLYQWLVDHAWEYDFYQLKTETWHWEYHPDTDRPEGCWAGKLKVQDRPVPKPK